MSGLIGCDSGPADGPATEAEQALFNFRSVPAVDNIPGYAGNGDIDLGQVNAGDDDDGFDIILFDIADVAVSDESGEPIQNIVGNEIRSPKTGNTLCMVTTSDDGSFQQLRNTQGTVLLSNYGMWTFDGEPRLADKTASQQYDELDHRLRYTYSNDMIYQGSIDAGEILVQSSAQVQHASAMRKLVIASLLEGYCGSPGI